MSKHNSTTNEHQPQPFLGSHSDSSNPQKFNRPVFRLRDIFKPSFDLWVISWLLGLVFAISMIALLMVSGWFITGAALAGMIAVGSHSFNYMLPAGVIRMLAMARTAGRYGELMVSHNAVFDLLKVLRLKFFNRLAALPLIQQRQTLQASQYMHRLVSDIDKLDEFILRVISPWLVASVTLLVLAEFMNWALPFYTSTKLSLYLLLLLALLIPLIGSYRGIATAKKLSQISESRRQRLLAPLSIITQLLLWQQWQAQTKAYVAADEELQSLEWQAQKLRSSYMLLIQWVFNAAILLVLYSVFKLSSEPSSPQNLLNAIDVPLILAVTLGILGIQEIIVPLGQHYLALGNSMAARDRLNSLLGKSVDISSELDLRPPLIKSNSEPEPGSEIDANDSTQPSGHSPGDLNHKLKLPLIPEPIRTDLKNVSAKIPGALIGAHEVSFTVSSGTPLIIKGPSGCGKSTLLQALAGELPLLSGTITLNEQPWFNYDWEDQLGYLGQQLDIFDQSLAANLRLGKPNASEDQLLAALEKVGLLPWVQAQPLGLETHLGEYGTAISGGQARRIALARLLLKPRRVLLLDEPFAGLDQQTRQQVWQSVRQQQQHDLLIVVSHHDWDMGACRIINLKEKLIID